IQGQPGQPNRWRGEVCHEPTPVRISPDGAVGIGASGAPPLFTGSRAGAGVATDQGRPAAAPELQRAERSQQYPSGEMSVYGLRKHMSKYLDKDVQVKAYLLQIYECPAELRKCNDELAAKSKKDKK